MTNSANDSAAFQSFTLPCGKVVKNRLVKAAMEENLAEDNQLPGQQLFTLYHAWARGGVGMILTGNVMIDHLAMTGPGGLALERDTDLAPFQELAKKAKQNNTLAIMQINHPGRQVFKKMGGKVLSPSDVPLKMGKHSGLFSRPKPMTIEEIHDLIERFITTAKQAKKAGFDGVQVHAAHGYLLAQFLSPLTNKRTDEWGGTLSHRAALLLEIVRGIRTACGDDFAVAVKLNSADFQRGGFDIEDAATVINMLGNLNVDFVELSGGSYEAPAMQGRTADGRTLAREAYFLEFAENIAKTAKMPIMTTGGIRRLPVANKVIESGVDLVGLASALASTPDLPRRWEDDPHLVGYIPVVTWKDKTLAGLATMALVKQNLRRVSRDKPASLNASPLLALVKDQVRSAQLTKRYQRQFKRELNQR
ncbi:NADH:flavin oxidoreductase/NADH oxidase family protein [Alteromonas sediminis]|uniref:NADH:flavin oxidoreductase/NADH oxidase family protein n=1 Tax=Alteromonas sediminis TaxID=2259342 RepID=A0A3N5Y0J0_9ALTE|nr:NADH:flavin oxidoreductase/NADH oxidase family protein [Alteromonas sediminis]RPJ66610.1 NADH:flavin oxidoreductase/NADH oxidase family protein [Alteromonas sediminis]